MDCQVLNSVRHFALALLLMVVVTGCTSKTVLCGGQVYPDNISADAMRVVKKAEVDSRVFCAGSNAGCDFTIAKTNQGWSVAATRTFAVDGKCASRLGDEKFYYYDGAGALIRVVQGI